MSSKIEYNSIGKTIEGTNYCAGIETFAQNLIEDNEGEATITYPSSDGWITVRSENFLINSDNAVVILPANIYKLIKFEVYLGNAVIEIGRVNGERSYLSDFNVTLHNNTLDISDFCVTKEILATLPIKNTKSSSVGTELNKQNVLEWNNNIVNVSMYKYENWFNGTIINLELAIMSQLYKTYGAATCYYYSASGDNYQRLDDTLKQGLFNIYINGEKEDLARKLKFRITYIPISSDTKLRARKSAKTNVDYIQPINQRAEINSVSALGKFLHNTAQKTGTSQITLVRWYKHLADIPPVGAWVKHKGERYILTANSYEMTNCVQLKVTHTLSKNWSNKSQYVSVDQKYRNYNIPADMLWRNLYWEDFVEVTTDDIIENVQAGALNKQDLAKIFKCDVSEDKTVTSFFMYKTDPITLDGVTAPCSTLGMANSIVFMASMKDNRSAGLRINADNSQYCEEVFYCNDDGTLNAASIILSDGVKNFDSAKYPYSDQNINHTLVNTPDNRIFQQNFYIDKDPGEALKFTYQVHFLSDNPDVIIGSKLSENHPLVKKWTGNRKFKFWKLNKKLRPGNDKVSASDGVGSSISSESTRAQYWGLADSTITGVQAFKLQLASWALLNLSDKKAWAITDEDNNLYVGCNDVSKTTLYFSHIHKRK